MKRTLTLIVLLLAMTVIGRTQELFSVQVKDGQRWPAAEADKLYLSACKVMEQEFGLAEPIRPRITLVLGAENDEAAFAQREIRLTRWNAYLFAQGVAIFAFEDLMDRGRVLAIARRAVTWSNATVEIRTGSKQKNRN